MDQKEFNKMIREENKRNEKIFINIPFKRELNHVKAQKEDEKHKEMMQSKGWMKR